MASTLDIKSLVGKPNTPETVAKVQSQLVAILEPALNSSDPSPTADSIASDIDKAYTAEYHSDEKAEDFIWTLWSLYIGIVKQLAVDDPRLPLLAEVVGRLKTKSAGTVKIWREDAKVWEDLPLLGGCMREAWNCKMLNTLTHPSCSNLKQLTNTSPFPVEPTYDGSDKDKAAIKSWITLNSFAARLLGSSTATWSNFAIWALRSALEHEPDSSSSATQSTHIAIAHEWIAHAGELLYKTSREGQELSKVDQRALAAGKLFGGEPGLNGKRWTFWREKLERLAQDGSGNAETKDKARKVAEEMKTIEG